MHHISNHFDLLWYSNVQSKQLGPTGNKQYETPSRRALLAHTHTSSHTYILSQRQRYAGWLASWSSLQLAACRNAVSDRSDTCLQREQAHCVEKSNNLDTIMYCSTSSRATQGILTDLSLSELVRMLYSCG
jgi:hypothetical protein